MTDIVWSLREDCPCISDIGCAQELCNQAAYEIKRLREEAEFNYMAGYDAAKDDYRDMLQERENEIERLRAALENIQQARVLQGKEIVDAANEIESLRLALEVAANDLEDWGAYTKAKNARAALEGE